MEVRRVLVFMVIHTVILPEINDGRVFVVSHQSLIELIYFRIQRLEVVQLLAHFLTPRACTCQTRIPEIERFLDLLVSITPGK